MNSATLIRELEADLASIPLIDIHTHLVSGRLGARGLHDVLLYHMVVSDLYSAGCPAGARLTQYPGWPSRDEAQARLDKSVKPSTTTPTLGRGSLTRSRLVGDSFTP